MATIGPLINASARLGRGYAERLLSGISPQDFSSYARVGDRVIESNHPAFICGHLSLYAPRVITGLGGHLGDAEPPAEFEQLFAYTAKCVDDPDGKIYPPMDQVTAVLFAGLDAAIALLESADDALLTAANTHERTRDRFPTIGSMFAFYLGGHHMMHMGQLSAWRRAMGLGPA